MPVTKSRANYPLSNEGQPQEPQFVRVVDAAGNDVQGSGPASQQVQGNVASSAADSGNPVKVGGKYNSIGYINPQLTDGMRGDLQVNASGALRVELNNDLNQRPIISTVTDANVAQNALAANSFGVAWNGGSWDRVRGDANGQVVQPALSATFWQYAAAAGGIVSSVGDVALKAAGGAGVRNFLSGLSISHDTLGAVTEFVIKDGAVIIYRGKLQTAAVDGSAGAGTIKFDPPLRGTAATALNFALLTSVTGGVFVNAQGYTGA